jgi:hypothetical protein
MLSHQSYAGLGILAERVNPTWIMQRRTHSIITSRYHGQRDIGAGAVEEETSRT